MTIFSEVLIFAAFWLFAVLSTLFYMHMFQLNSYRADDQWHWMLKNRGKVVPLALPLIGAVIGVICGKNAGMIVCAVFILLACLFYKPKKAKKPLKYTPRVRRMLVTVAVLYAAMTVLLAVFASGRITALVVGLVAAASPFVIILANIINKPIELSINRYYTNDAKKMLAACPNLTVIGVTGSYGKTSVKFYLNTLLKAKYNVLMTPESYNTPMGVVKTVRGSLRATHEIFICEMGAKYVGDIKELCDIVHPKHGIITSIGPQHLESFKSLQNVINTKFELADALSKDGMLFLNGDNEYIAERAPDGAITYGLNSDSKYKAKLISVGDKGTTFEVTTPDGEKEEFTTKLIGTHNCLNILGAIAVSHELGISLAELRPQVRRLESVPHRLELSKRVGMTLIDDSYNSNPSGTKAALETLSFFEGEKILVTPGMVELGDKQEEYNCEFGRNAAAVCDYVALVGERQTKSIYKGLVEAGFDESMSHSFISPKFYDMIGWDENDPRRISTTILNPLGEDFSVMRTTVLPSMLDNLAHNHAHRNPTASLYELGTIYTPTVKDGKADPDVLPHEEKILTLGSYGRLSFFQFKGAIEALLRELNIKGASFAPEKANPSYHPGRCAKVLIDGKEIGVFGTIHPTVAARYGLSGEVLAAELQMDALLAAIDPEKLYHPLPKFPASTRDIAVLVDDAVPAASMQATVEKAAGKLLESVKLFDVYKGKGIPEGKKSVAYSLSLRAPDRTLTDEECDKAMRAAISALETEFGAQLRG